MIHSNYFSGLQQLLHADDHTMAAWVRTTPGHSQLVSFTVLKLNTSPISEEDLQFLKTENIDKDALFESR